MPSQAPQRSGRKPSGSCEDTKDSQHSFSLENCTSLQCASNLRTHRTRYACLMQIAVDFTQYKKSSPHSRVGLVRVKVHWLAKRRMWRRLVRPAVLRPAASVIGLSTFPLFQPTLGLRYFSDDARQLAPYSASAHVLWCSPKKATLKCSGCGNNLPHEAYAPSQQRRSTRKCKTCTAPAATLTCTQCHEQMPKESFSGNQQKRSNRTCAECCSRNSSTTLTTLVEFLVCTTCGEQMPRQNFAAREQNRSTRTCKDCTKTGRPPEQLERIALGTLSKECAHCEAALFACEQGAFCCGHGEHYVDFTSFYTPSGETLLKIFRKTWPYRDQHGHASHDPQTNAPRITGFSAMSRRYNNLFTLAVHEIHSTTSERELRFGNELRPSNIRIHGTLYRRIWTCADNTPLRYLVVDPTQRTTQARGHHVDLKILAQLERAIVPHNAYMQELKHLSGSKCRAPVVSVELQWDEGLSEVAAILHETPGREISARSVLFQRQSIGKPSYLQPLSALYEPLSYPLWFPYGGRGWSTDVRSAGGQNITQMWWYRQHLLRMSHMHLCGRLLNEWLVNMFCRMEDERFSLIRSKANAPQVMANEAPGTQAVGTSTFLPSNARFSTSPAPLTY